MDQLVGQEFSWLHVMNVSLGAATLLVVLWMVFAVAREIVRHRTPHTH